MSDTGAETSANAPLAGGAPTLRIDGDLTVYTAGEWRARLASALDPTTGQGTLIDVSRVTEIDTAGLQLLLMARRAAAARPGPFALLAPSPSVRDLLQLCGLDHLIREGVPAEPDALARSRS